MTNKKTVMFGADTILSHLSHPEFVGSTIHRTGVRAKVTSGVLILTPKRAVKQKMPLTGKPLAQGGTVPEALEAVVYGR